MRNQTSSLLSDPMNFLNTQQPAEAVDNLPDIDYHNIKKAAMVLRSINHNLRQQVIKTIDENKRQAIAVRHIHTAASKQ